MISIIIPTLESPTSLVKLLESIGRQDFPVEKREILVVHNFPDPHRIPLHQRVSINVREIVAPMPGVNHARNAGIAEARGDILFFVDDDCFFGRRDFLRRLEERHQELPSVAAIGGPYRLKVGSSFWSRAYHHNMETWISDQLLDSQRSRALLGGNASYKSWVFREGLNFDGAIMYGGSETPFNDLVFEKFGPLYFFEDLGLEHNPGMGFVDFVRKAFKQGQGFLRQSRRNRQLPKNSPAVRPPSAALRPALSLYNFSFMVGVRSMDRGKPRWALLCAVEEMLHRWHRPWGRLFQTLSESWQLAKADHES